MEVVEAPLQHLRLSSRLDHQVVMVESQPVVP